MKLFQVVDKDGNKLWNVGRKAKHFYPIEQDAKGVATQYNNLWPNDAGAPFKVKTLIVTDSE